MKPRSKTDGLQLDDVSIALAGRVLLSVSFAVHPGEIVTIMGPSGSGKSALLAYIGGFLDPVFKASGHISMDGDDLTLVPAEMRGAGILFQDPLLFPHLSVGGNLLFGLTGAIRKRDQRRRMAEQALADVELSGFFDRDPETLSGGQKARVALQRVMLSAPRFLLLDEPFSSLDAALRVQTRALIFSRAKSAQLPVVLVTHDRADAEAAGGAILTIGGEMAP